MAVTTYSYTQIEPGFAGYFDLISTANARHFDNNAVWSCVITGTDATLNVSGGAANPYVVVVDGVKSVPTISGGSIDLFSGLSDVPHQVSINVNFGYTPTFNTIPTDDVSVLSITGSSPSFTPLVTHIISDPTFVGISSETEVAAVGGNFTPTYDQVSPDTVGRGSIIIKSQLDEIWVYTSHNAAWYSVDGGTPIQVTFSFSSSERRQVKLTDGLDNTQEHIYTIWGDDEDRHGFSGITPKINNTSASLSSVLPRTTITHLGDSITAGQGATLGAVDCWLYSNDNDYAITQFGEGGQTTSDLTTAIPSYFAEIYVPDYVLLAIGRNDVGNAALQTDYTACLQALLDEGCINILCRGILPEGSNLYATENAAIQSAISSFSDPNIQFIDTSTWSGIETADGVHPTATGYETINSYESPVLSAIISPPATYELTGITYDKAGSVLPSCQVSLFKHSGSGVYVYQSTQVSDTTTGAYDFSGLADNDSSYMVVAHKDGTPNVFDISDNNLTPVEE